MYIYICICSSSPHPSKSVTSRPSAFTMVAMKAMKAGARAMTQGDLTKKIAETTQLKTKDVKGVFAALQTIAYAEVKKTEKFVIPQLTTLKLKHKPARKAGKRVMFGKEVKVAAKPASKVVKAFPAKALKDSI
jgi:nucleoid DNA-binding protein